MVFVTVGSQKFKFDRLIKAVDELARDGSIDEPVFAQTGVCTYQPKHISSAPFLDRDEFNARICKADLVVTHAGTGAIIGAVKAGKKVIAVPRLAEYGEHVDNHQGEIVRRFAEMGFIEPCMKISNLKRAYDAALSKSYRSYSSNNETFVADLRAYLESISTE